MLHNTAINQYNLLTIETCYFGTQGKLPGQYPNFPGQHKHFEDNSRFSRSRMNPELSLEQYYSTSYVDRSKYKAWTL